MGTGPLPPPLEEPLEPVDDDPDFDPAFDPDFDVAVGAGCFLVPTFSTLATGLVTTEVPINRLPASLPST